MDWPSVRGCAFLGGNAVTNGVSLGICAMDYRSDDPNPNANTRGLIVDNVSRCEESHIRLLIRSSGHARTHGEVSSSAMSLDRHFRCEPDQ